MSSSTPTGNPAFSAVLLPNLSHQSPRHSRHPVPPLARWTCCGPLSLHTQQRKNQVGQRSLPCEPASSGVHFLYRSPSAPLLTDDTWLCAVPSGRTGQNQNSRLFFSTSWKFHARHTTNSSVHSQIPHQIKSSHQLPQERPLPFYFSSRCCFRFRVKSSCNLLPRNLFSSCLRPHYTSACHHDNNISASRATPARTQTTRDRRAGTIHRSIQ